MGTELILGFLKRTWPYLVIASLSLALMVALNSRKQILLEYEDAQSKWKLQIATAQAATEKQRTEYESAAKIADAKTKALVQQAEQLAVKNYIAKYGNPYRLAAVSPSFSGLRLSTATSTRTGTDESSEIHDGIQEPEPVPAPDTAFITTCAKDAGMIEAWKELCNNAKCEVVD